MAVSFENTEVAFAHKSNYDLKKAYWLFKLVGNPFLVKFGKISVSIALKLGLPIGWAMRKNIFAQFCGGETIAECANTTKILDGLGVGTILDYSVEGKESEGEFDHTADEIFATIQTAKGNANIPFCVFKVTGIARHALLEKVNLGSSLSAQEKDEFELVKNRVNRLCKAAFEANTPIFIDAEESWIQDAIDQLAEDMMALYNTNRAIVYNTAQLYRHDRLSYIEAAHERASNGGYYFGVKLVRGAYMEKERNRADEMGYTSPIQATKEDTDRDFNAALVYCISNIDRIAICAGTHNEESSALLTRLINEKGIDHQDPRVYAAQLFGMSDHLSFNLSHSGYRVAKYVPYGPIREVIPYLIRRAEENTSVKGQTGRELGLIIKELKRRKVA
ncbi:MAG: proline dehydrogenase family protein [Flavobacteriales bacterium]|nr:proline dehydrogenase family protein [Flavobacteriales bacterium]